MTTGLLNKRVIQDLGSIASGGVIEGESLSRHTTYRVGGEAELFVVASNSNEAAGVFRYAKRAGVPLTLLGAGSNVIPPDDGIEGIVLQLRHETAAVEFLDNGNVLADAGFNIVDLARVCARRGLRGLTSIAGVPGSVGGAVLMNAKVVREETGALLERVEVVTSSGRRRVFKRGEMSFGYRSSMFQGAGMLILRAEFRLKPGDPETVIRDVEDEWKRWRSRFPLDPPNAGSVFKRPEGDFAGRLIEEAGCKGLTIGGARVSEAHANFIHNIGRATAADIIGLIDLVRERVLEKTGVNLELEQIPLPVRPQDR
jgi:UDP-N-acetylmuramate dehydrogenase